MLFTKLFKKDYRYYREKGEQLLGAQRYAEARLAFQESLQKLPPDSESAASENPYLTTKIAETGNRLGEINLAEAEHALRRGDHAKAREHIGLVLELAEDVAIREKAEDFLKSAVVDSSEQRVLAAKHDCSECKNPTGITLENSDVSYDTMSVEDRFELLIQTLPPDLAKRYGGLGEKFACGYASLHNGELDIARPIFEEMLAQGESDILHYELSLIDFKMGDIAECEGHLRRALALNDRNSLCYIALVHLLVETGRVPDAIPLLHTMMENNIAPEQAVFLLGDVHTLLGDSEQSINCFSQALVFPEFAKAAAERLIPQLQSLGRTEEAAYLIKRYLKGCC